MFFIHHLVRHDTAKSPKFLLSLLPVGKPPFQKELSTVWTGPFKQKTIAGVLKIYTKPEDATKVTKIFKSTLKRSNRPTSLGKITSTH
jgi:hypothetical protein